MAQSRFKQVIGGSLAAVPGIEWVVNLASVLVMLCFAVVLPIYAGMPLVSLLGVALVAALSVSLGGFTLSDGFRRFGIFAIYGGVLATVAWTVFVEAVSPVITVYFPAILLLAAAQVLGTGGALFWGAVSLVLVAAGVFYPPPPAAAASPLVTFATRAGVLGAILFFGISFRRAQDRQAEELALQATTDPLTGLPNRREFDRALDEAVLRNRRFGRRGAIVYLDLDGLKPVNDEIGHAAGDALLCTIANRMRRIGRGVDTAARLGGDEFVVLLSELEDPKGAEIFAQKLLATIREPVILEGHPIHPGASLGVVHFPQPCDEPGELMRRADEAMYAAKRAGGDRVTIWQEEGMRELVEVLA